MPSNPDEWDSGQPVGSDATRANKSRPPFPPELKWHAILSLGLVAAFFAVSTLLPIVLPMVLVVIAGAVLWLCTGWSLLTNRNRLAERQAEWGRSRSLLLGAGSVSVPINRLGGLSLIVGGGFLTFGSAWIAVANWQQLI
jgi:hypothetical protein